MASITTLSQTVSRVPPGPMGLGSLLAFQRDPLGFFTRCAQDHGDICRIRLLDTTFWLINDPFSIEQILTSTEGRFSKNPPNLNGIFLGNGLITSNGDFWLRQRRMIQPAFHRSHIHRYADEIQGFGERMFTRWQAGPLQQGTPIDLQEEMMRVSLEIVAKLFFHVDLSKGESFDVGDAFGEITNLVERGRSSLFFKLPFHPGHHQIREATKRLDRVIFAMIEKRRQSSEDPGDLLTTLLNIKDEEGNPMSDKQLRDEATTMFLAGHETTALGLAWTLYLISQDRTVEEKLLEEIRCVLNGRTCTVADIAQLSYTDRVIKEALRLYPPVWLPSDRFITVDGELGGYPISKGTTVVVTPWVTHHDPRWFPDPLRFRPERWEEEAQKRIPRYAYFPFGGGPRYCIGAPFATLVTTILLTSILQRYRFELKAGQRIIPQPAITLRSKYGSAWEC